MLFFFKQKTAYEMRISDWSSDVCSSDLLLEIGGLVEVVGLVGVARVDLVPLGLRKFGFQRHDRFGVGRGVRQLGQRQHFFDMRSEERSVGKECVSTCSTGW